MLPPNDGVILNAASGVKDLAHRHAGCTRKILRALALRMTPKHLPASVLVLGTRYSVLATRNYSAIFATCRSNPVLGSNDVSSNALKPSPVISV